MHGKRVLIVGASSGIGRAMATSAIRRGASVALSARRRQRLEEAIAEAGGGHAIAADVRVPADCERLVDEAVAALGGIDLVVFATGISPLRRALDTDETDWHEVLSTNLVGAHLLLRALAPRLDDGTLVALLSSDSVGTPRPGLIAYASSKAALEELIKGWRFEHPSLRFSCLAVGPTVPTEFAAQFDPDLLMEMFGVWTKLGMVHADVMETDAVAGLLLDTLGLVLAHPEISLDYLLVRPSPRITKPAEA